MEIFFAPLFLIICAYRQAKSVNRVLIEVIREPPSDIIFSENAPNSQQVLPLDLF